MLYIGCITINFKIEFSRTRNGNGDSIKLMKYFKLAYIVAVYYFAI